MSHPGREPEIESEFRSPAILDSRRLLGPNLFHQSIGAVLDVALDDATPDRNQQLLTAWHERASALADALDWSDAETMQRTWPGGASLFISAPFDQLMTATEVTELAWLFAESRVTGSGTTDAETASLMAFSRNEMRVTASGRRPLRELWSEAERLGLNVTFDESRIAIGTGVGAISWPIEEIPLVEEIDWLAARDIPIVLVTGSNGKTTVVRMVAAIARAAGHTVGYTCTDGVWIGESQVESGDYSGPAGARRVLQDTSVTLAVLETARGGMLRRGLAMQHASVAAIVTLSADHFGSYGISDLASLADVKMIVGRVVEERGSLVLNASVPELRAAAERHAGRAVGISMESVNGVTQNSFRNSNKKSFQNSGEHSEFRVQFQEQFIEPFEKQFPITRLTELESRLTPPQLAQIPATLNGLAHHNVLNAAIAITIAHELNLDLDTFDALRTFGAQPTDNTGRLMLKQFAGITTVIDYAHNPQSVAALIDATSQLPATRRAITLGTGGDRDDEALQSIAQAAAASDTIDFFIAKEMPKFLRGRAAGVISGVIRDALLSAGIPAQRCASATDDLDAVRIALAWAHPGDLLLLTVHDQREAILALVDTLASSNWQAGDPLPA